MIQVMGWKVVKSSCGGNSIGLIVEGSRKLVLSHIRALLSPMVVLMELTTLLQRLGGLVVMGSLWKKARKQIQQPNRPLIEYHEEYMIRAIP